MSIRDGGGSGSRWPWWSFQGDCGWLYRQLLLNRFVESAPFPLVRWIDMRPTGSTPDVEPLFSESFLKVEGEGGVPPFLVRAALDALECHQRAFSDPVCDAKLLWK